MPSVDLWHVIRDKGYDLAWAYIERHTKTDTQRTHTLYSSGDPDVSILARAHGGTGHPTHAGWIELVGHDCLLTD